MPTMSNVTVHQILSIHIEYTFSMFNINMSHSVDYRAEGCRGGNIRKHRSFRLIVCAEDDVSLQKVIVDDNAVLCLPSHGRNLPLYQYKMEVWGFVLTWPNMTLVLDTNSTLEPLVDDLRGRLQVHLNNLLVTLSEITRYDSYLFLISNFYCTIWSSMPKLQQQQDSDDIPENCPCSWRGKNDSPLHFQSTSLWSGVLDHSCWACQAQHWSDPSPGSGGYVKGQPDWRLLPHSSLCVTSTLRGL